MDPLRATLHKASRSVSRDAHDAASFRRVLEALADVPVSAPARARLPRALAWALVAVCMAGTGATVTYASARALPGEALYAVKLRVVEPAETALALSAEAKADVAVAHLERRFQEAAALSAAGSLEAHDETLAAAAEKDLAVVDRDEQPVARARFQALASVYAPRIRAEDAARSRFALATRLGAAGPRVDDAVARDAARAQIALARERTVALGKVTVSAEVSARLRSANRFSKAASADLDKGAFQSALTLSGDAVRAAAEAQLIAGMTSGSSTTSTGATATTSSSTAPSPSSTTSSPGGSAPSGTGPGGFLRTLLH